MATGIIGGGGSSSSGKTHYVSRFTSSGTFSLPVGYGGSNPLTVEAILVGGGGGSGCNYFSSGSVSGGGGGGGGYREATVSLTADAPIVVGRGGIGGRYVGDTNGQGGNGSCSAIGATPKNLWINPACIPSASGGPGGWNWIQTGNNATYLSGQQTAGSINGGLLTINNGGNSGFSIDSQPYRVTPGVTYTFSYYAYGNTAGRPFGAQLLFFSSTTKSTSAAATSTLGNTALSTTTWGSRPSFSFTPAAGQDVVVIRLTDIPAGSSPTAGQVWLSNFQLEVGSSATTYVDGDSSGYTWTGVREGGESIPTGALAAVPGGGGGGSGLLGGGGGGNANGSWAVSGGLAGTTGATSGGGAGYISTTGLPQYSGHGGGAGGSAEWPSLIPNNTGSAATFTSNPRPGYAPFGVGSSGFSSANATVISRGGPGPGLASYGAGGWGYDPADTAQASLPNTTGVVTPNTGMGAPATRGSAGSANQQIGNNGSDGVVILRYWA